MAYHEEEQANAGSRISISRFTLRIRKISFSRLEPQAPFRMPTSNVSFGGKRGLQFQASATCDLPKMTVSNEASLGPQRYLVQHPAWMYNLRMNGCVLCGSKRSLEASHA